MSPELENFLYLAVLPTAGAFWLLVAGWHIKLLVYLVQSVTNLAHKTELHDHRLTRLETTAQHANQPAKG